MIYVTVYEQDARIATILQEILKRATTTIGNVERASGWNDVRKAAAVHTGSVVVLGFDTKESDLQQVVKTTRDYPGTSFVYVVDEVTAETLQGAMRHGIRDVVAIDDAEAELAAAVIRAHAMAEADVGTRSAGAETKGKVVTVFGVKGGTGKTMVATNLAVLAAKAGIQTALVDAGVRFGDCAAVLRVRPERTMADLFSATGVIDDTLLSGIMTPHDSGLRLLCAPTDPLAAENLEGDVISRTIENLRHNFELVVVDTGPAFDQFTFEALSASDLAYLVTSLELPAVKDAKLALSVIERLHLGDDKVRIVLNRANSKVGFPPEEVAKALGRRATAQLPSDVEVPRSMNTGVPVVTESPKARISKSLTELSKEMREEVFGKPQTSGGRQRLRAIKTRTAES